MSLYIGSTAALIALAIGTLMSAITGVKEGLIDDSLMAVTNIIIAVPSILLMMLTAAYFRYQNHILVAVIIRVTFSPRVARAVRTQIMSLKAREFIYLSRTAGYTDFRIAVKDLLLNLGACIFMAFVLFISGAMIAEAGLRMIGTGITQGASLGIILNWAQIMKAVRRGLRVVVRPSWYGAGSDGGVSVDNIDSSGRVL